MPKFLCLCLILTLCACKPEEYRLHLVHTGDLHSHLLPFNDYGDCDIEAPDCLGGFARISAFMKQEQQRHPHTLFLDSGDRFSGTAFYTLGKSRYLSKTMRHMPYDVMTFGNHEFDENADEALKFVQAMDIPVVAANFSFLSPSPLAKYITPSVILEKNHRKIGIIGVVTEDISPLGKQQAQLNISAVIPAVQKEIGKLQKQGVNIIIVLSHIGLDEDIRLAEAIPDIDIIAGGHSHSLLNNDSQNKNRSGDYPLAVNNGRTLIIHNGMGGQYVGVLDVLFNKNGEIIRYDGDTQPVNGQIPNDRITAEIIKNAEKDLSQILQQKITDNRQILGLTPNRNHCAENCPVGEAVAALLHKAYPQADAAIYNSGAIRQALPEGSVTYNQLIQTFPFDSRLLVLKMSADEIRNYIKHGLSHYHPSERTNEMLQTSGLSYTFDEKTKELISITLNGKELNNEQTYYILTTEFIAAGGDGYPPAQEHIPLDVTAREALLQQILRTPKLNYSPKHTVSKQ